MYISLIAIKLSTIDIKLHVSTYDKKISSHRDVYDNDKEVSGNNN